jgi:transposase
MEPLQRRKYNSEFKTEAVRLVLNGKSITDVASDLGINPNVLSRWRREYLNDNKHAFPGKGHLRPEDERIRQLERQLRDVTEERDILKKAMAIFSKQSR